jgi:hypothetical protein
VSVPSDVHYCLHETPAALAALTDLVARQQRMWIDTELADWNTPNPRLSLIQMRHEDSSVHVVDVLSPEMAAADRAARPERDVVVLSGASDPAVVGVDAEGVAEGCVPATASARVTSGGVNLGIGGARPSNPGQPPLAPIAPHRQRGVHPGKPAVREALSLQSP